MTSDFDNASLKKAFGSFATGVAVAAQANAQAEVAEAQAEAQAQVAEVQAGLADAVSEAQADLNSDDIFFKNVKKYERIP